MKLIKYTLALATLGLCGEVEASSFVEALDLLTEASLSLKQQRANDRATVQEMRNENMLPAPEASFGYLWGSNAEAGNKWNLSISQSIDWPGLYRARSRAIDANENALDYLYKSSVVDVRMEARLLLLDLIRAKKILAIDEKIHSDYHAIEALAQREISAANITRLDYNKAVIERVNAGKTLNSDSAYLEAQKCRLAELAGSQEVAAKVLETLGDEYPNEIIPAEMSEQDLMTLDPAIAAADANLKSAQELLKAEKLSRLPGFSLAYEHETEAAGGFNGFSVGISLPFFGGKGRVKAAELKKLSAQTELMMQSVKRRTTFSAARATARKAWASVEELREVVETDANLKLLEKARNAGQITLREYYQEANYFLEAVKAYEELLYQYHCALAELHRFE